MLDAPSTRKSVNLSIEAELLEEAKTLGIDLSRAAGVGVSDAIRRRKGELWLEENREQVEMIEERIKARCVGAALRQNPQMKRALDNFKAVLDLRVNQSDITDAQIKKIIAVIDRAAFDITQLD